MNFNYDNKNKKYYLDISVQDKCFSCGNVQDCPLIHEVNKQNLIMKKEYFYIEECKMYFYCVSKEVEDKFKGFYFGDPDDKGWSPNDKYRYR